MHHNDVSEGVGDTACILASLYDYISRQNCEVLAFTFLVLTPLRMLFLLVRLVLLLH